MTRTLHPEPRWITEAMLLSLHAQQIERFGGAHGVIDQNVVLPALARPQHRWHNDERTDLADLAAAFLLGFARSQGFRDGNKRTGLSTALVFLALNGVMLDVAPDELYALTVAIAKGQGDDTMAAAYLRSRMRTSACFEKPLSLLPPADLRHA